MERAGSGHTSAGSAGRPPPSPLHLPPLRRKACHRGQFLSAVSPDNAISAEAASPSSRSVTPRAGAGLRGFWAWWTRALATWVPAPLRGLLGLSEQRLLLRRDGDDLVLSMVAAPGANPTGPAAVGVALRDIVALPWDAVADPGEEAASSVDPLSAVLAPRVESLPRWLLLPAHGALRRQVTLPGAAADRLRDVLRFEIDRQTPFSADEVYFDARPLGRRGDGMIDAELVVVPRARLDAALAALTPSLRSALAGVDLVVVTPPAVGPAAADRPADAVEAVAAGADGASTESGPMGSAPTVSALGVNLLPSAQRRTRRDPMALWNLGLGVLATVAIALGLWQILANRTAAADAYEAETQQRSAQAKRVAAERKQLVDLVEGLRFLQQTRSGRPTSVEVLAELTARLPDSTYIERVTIEDQRLMVVGLSSEASRLVERLQGSQLWRAMTLTGALQPDPRSGKDRFTLTAELVVNKPAERAPAKPRNGARSDGEP